MKRIIFLIAGIIALHLHGFTQVMNPVQWDFSSEKLDNNEHMLTFKATIDRGWHMYGMDIPDNGPIATSINFEESDSYELLGAIEVVTKPKEKYDASFQMDIDLHSNEAIFQQKVLAVDDGGVSLQGFVEFMSCDDERCLPPKQEDFSFNLRTGGSPESNLEQKQEVDTDEAPGLPSAGIAVDVVQAEAEDEPATPLETDKEEERSLWVFFLISFLAGLAGILTPCVFPMIPMTVTFFMQGSKKRSRAIIQGLVFGLSVVAIYTSIGLIVSVTSAGADFATQLSTHWIPNIIFFTLFIVFAASFFGMFELVLPSSLVNKADQQADKGGLLGAFFMALTLVVVSFSCTGPIVGALLVESAGGLALKPIIGMFGFSLAFALPFTLFAIFPSWLKGLPKSGGWLNSVKIVLGFVVLAFGFKFLSNINQSYHLNILSRDVYLAIWIIIFFFLGLYLIGKIKFAHDSEVKFISFPRMLLAIASFTFALYLIPGLFGAQLRAVSSLIPPQSAQNFSLVQGNMGYSGILNSPEADHPTFCGNAKYSDFLHLPYGLQGYFDYEEGMECAKKLNKPVFLDFNGHSCSNCKEMEAKVWSDPQVLERLRQDFVIIALYVDDRTKLPEDEWVTSTFDGKIKKTMGQRNADFQISRFNTNTQPYYIITDTDGNELAGPYGLNLDIEEFIDFLDRGKAAFPDQAK